ncbi:hypothetical protein [Actinokineospora iranica]|uniref:Tetratricopeptide repeat-containing protein n=1 Tax=Actinokineospora iranica TaxID=1271860 RepID=A0A1G6VUD1_9PSEU|nr:hypothetical protein [Actinokineospora iranica]SDD57290.1 hypothetical protein SAMN05216174_113106 [Actinokineospora iranica]
MHSPERQPNERLRSLIREARFTNHAFARALNDIGKEAGISIHYDRTSVSHWLSGTHPRQPTPVLIAELLTRRLNRMVHVEQLGLTTPVAPPPPDSEFTLSSLQQLAMMDLNPVNRSVLLDTPYLTQWATVPEWLETSAGTLQQGSTTKRAGLEVVRSIRSMVAVGAELDQMFGGERGRIALTTHLGYDIPAWLRAKTTESVQQELFAAVSSLVYLIGFMTFDSLKHHIAQRYFRAALHLSSLGNDWTCYVHVLHDMSVQATFLGHHELSVHLVSTALRKAETRLLASVQPALLGQSAVAHAALGRTRTATRLLDKANHALTHDCDQNRVDDRADLAYRTAQVSMLSRDWKNAEKWLRISLKYRSSIKRRSRLMTQLQLAETLVREGRPEHACATWCEAMTEYSKMDSGRVRIRMENLYRLIVPFCNRRTVRSTLDQAHGMLAADFGDLLKGR